MNFIMPDPISFRETADGIIEVKQLHAIISHIFKQNSVEPKKDCVSKAKQNTVMKNEQ